MKSNTVFSSPIIGNDNFAGQSKVSLPTPPSVNVHSDESNRAIQSLNSRFTGDETKREKTPADFLRQILVEQPIKSGAKTEPLEIKVGKSPQQATAADYNRAAWRAVFNKAGCGILTDGEIQQAVGAMRDNKLNTEFSGFNIDNLRRKDAQPGAMFVYADKATVESAKRAAQAVLQYQEYKAKQSDANQERAQNEVNQMFADQGRVLWNSAVNIAEGTINTALDAASTGGGTNPLPLLNPNRPQVDFSSVKSDYRSEMMRRDLNGKLDGDGIKAGQFIETGVTVIAPLIIGKVIAPTQLTELNLVSTEKLPTGLFSSKSLEGVEKATPKLINDIEKKGRTVVIAKEGSEELRFLNFFDAEANAGGVGNTHIILRENPSKAALLEEFLHGTQSRLGIINKLGDVGAEIHVKGFMIRHHRMLGLIDEDVEILKTLKVLEQRRLK